MGLFGFACGRCWNYNCNCSESQLIKYEKECKKNRENAKPLEYSTTEPKVCEGNIIVKNDSSYLVTNINNGVGYVCKITNVTADMEFDIILKEPYLKMESN